MLENEGVALRAVRWSEICPWLSLTTSFRLAITFRLMTLGAAAALLTLLGWWQIAWLFSHETAEGKSAVSAAETNVEKEISSVPSQSWSGLFSQQSPWQVIDRSVPNRPFGGLISNPADTWGMKIGEQGGPMISTWALFNHPVWRIFSIGAGDAVTFSDLLSLFLSAAWSLAVWAFFGAAIHRVAAVQLATGEQVGWGAALRWARAKWLAYIAAAVLPIVGVTIVGLPIFVLGLLMKVGFFAILTALIWPLVLIGGFVITLLVAGVLLGWPLMWATISVEGTDSFDALNRTYSYVFQKPVRYFLYVLAATVLGWMGWFVVVNFAAAVIWFADWAAGWGAGALRMQELAAGDSSLSHAATSLIGFWAGWVKLLAVGYSFSYFGVASTAVYYLLRRDVDARETDEVFLDADTSEQRFGLPKIQKDAAGAPEVAESRPAGPLPADGQVEVE